MQSRLENRLLKLVPLVYGWCTHEITRAIIHIAVNSSLYKNITMIYACLLNIYLVVKYKRVNSACRIKISTNFLFYFIEFTCIIIFY